MNEEKTHELMHKLLQIHKLFYYIIYLNHILIILNIYFNIN